MHKQSVWITTSLPAAEETGRDASGAASASQMLQDLSDHVGQ